ncbi:MAG: hypothetical protein KDH94_01665 [Coxiellaceae bacterium]|nr:hypothetical protein [Coxiellaceae bacterium]
MSRELGEKEKERMEQAEFRVDPANIVIDDGGIEIDPDFVLAMQLQAEWNEEDSFFSEQSSQIDELCNQLSSINAEKIADVLMAPGLVTKDMVKLVSRSMESIEQGSLEYALLEILLQGFYMKQQACEDPANGVESYRTCEEVISAMEEPFIAINEQIVATILSTPGLITMRVMELAKKKLVEVEVGDNSRKACFQVIHAAYHQIYVDFSSTTTTTTAVPLSQNTMAFPYGTALSESRQVVLQSEEVSSDEREKEKDEDENPVSSFTSTG